MTTLLRSAFAPLSALLLLSACATTGGGAAYHPEATPYLEVEDAAADLAAAEAGAAIEGKLLLAVFGANWCHDSRALAGWLESERFRPLIEPHFTVVYIDVGTPQNGEGRNLELAAMRGVEDIEGTPNLLVIRPGQMRALNADSAKTWRNAASRSADEIYAELASYVSAQE